MDPGLSCNKYSQKFAKVCNVCGDRARSLHFGGLSCESCKAFFRRCVRIGSTSWIRCSRKRTCDINIMTRTNCQYCRFQKCLAAGMESSWVLTEEQRYRHSQWLSQNKHNKETLLQQQPYKSDIPKTFFSPFSGKCVERETVSIQSTNEKEMSKEFGEINARTQHSLNCTGQMAGMNKSPDYLSADDHYEIESIVEKYHKAVREIPFAASQNVEIRDMVEFVGIFTTSLRQFVHFSKLHTQFATLSFNDQRILLRDGGVGMCLLRGAFSFDIERYQWNLVAIKQFVPLLVDDVKSPLSFETFQMYMGFIAQMKALEIDESITMLLIMIVLFSSEQISLADVMKISQAQEKYLVLLKKYVSWKFGGVAGGLMYPKFLQKLTDLRQLSDHYEESKLHLESRDAAEIKGFLENLTTVPSTNKTILPLPEYFSGGVKYFQPTLQESPITLSMNKEETEPIRLALHETRVPSLSVKTNGSGNMNPLPLPTVCNLSNSKYHEEPWSNFWRQKKHLISHARSDEARTGGNSSFLSNPHYFSSPHDLSISKIQHPLAPDKSRSKDCSLLKRLLTVEKQSSKDPNQESNTATL